MLPQVVEQTMNTLCNALVKNNVDIDSVYLYGSVALGDYIEGSSDIDFIAILQKPATESDIQSIAAAHTELENVFPHTDIMGAYLLRKDIGKPQSAISSLITYYYKQVHTDGSGSDINPVTWWILGNHGIKVFGSAQALKVETDNDVLLQFTINNLNSYWLGWIHRLEKHLASFNSADPDPASTAKQFDEAVELCTLGMLRQLYTLNHHDIKSKVEAGYYGITMIPQQWHELIYEAINIKRMLPKRFYHSNEKRLMDLVGLLRYIHLEANRVYDEWVVDE
ncbi:nucleotidyltransferase domain-containing protein [Paenibacillus sp. MMS20-IR301]|uniref:nucleotidyltransferase domain-containing protein n=1 Tax=Paenibacillus sp. MMS20-IR301 TaxID=2895946 RepID=UPI0028EF47DB|nr:nucleotidyltransferase domain-containing protein [Paenibacillus sp. MMS20-IR301]WNS45818.1 nucleotidyltransferase domain-containing protein [Paenibacillus sp. MMS20-IR301]